MFDRSESFDVKWAGPAELKPAVYRTQSEKRVREFIVTGELTKKLVSRLDLQPSGCLIWTGYCKNGYGYMMHEKYPLLTHRLAYVAFYGEIPTGMEIDHLCRNRSCANPFHLDCVNRRENVLRSESFSAKYAKQTHCKRGHELIGYNIVKVDRGNPRRRRCRLCANLRRRMRSV